MNHSKTRGHLAAIFTIIIWGTTFVSTKVLLNDFTPIEILFLRFIAGYFALWLIYPHKLSLVNAKQEWYFAFAGLCGITLYFLFENIALTYTLASNVGIIVSVSPFVSAIFSYIFLKEKKPGIRFYAGFFIAMMGICMISLNKNAVFDFSPIGNLLALLAAFIWAAYSTLSKKISTFGYPIIPATRRCFFYGILFMFPWVIGMKFDVSLFEILIPINLLNLLFLGFGASAICFLTWNYAVKNLGVVHTSVYIYLVPIITTLTSVLILKEPITQASIGGICFILLGLFLSENK